MDSKQGIHVMTLANSIIGVSILAMPYCFKQCGIILSIVLLILSSIISRLACHFLLKSAMKARLRTFEFLAYHVFGSLGKLFVEIGMIGFLIGTCIAFFVVMGDLGPQIIAHMSETISSDTMRTYILIALALFCVLPLGLLRNVDSLSGVCTATIGFYACLVLKIMAESAPHLLLSDWFDKVNYWRPAGILQCIPIFSMALFCQTQLFEIYQAIPNASLEKMNELVRMAVNICTCVYIFVGVFGYIAISHEVNFTGNILMNFKPSIITEVMKIGFVLSVAFSFPLVIFPCRASLYSLIYKPTYSALHEASSFYIPEGKFKILTFLIVIISLTIGIYIPNIELVLGLVGSTIGVMICVLFPAACFICLTSKNTNERILAQIMLFIGIVVMVLGTYANLYAIEEVAHSPIIEKPIMPIDVQLNKNSIAHEAILITTLKNLAIKDSIDLDKNVIQLAQIKEIRHEPPQPEAPLEEPQNVKAPNVVDKPVDVVVEKKTPQAEPLQNLTKKNIQIEIKLPENGEKIIERSPIDINLGSNDAKAKEANQAENNIENPNDSTKNIPNKPTTRSPDKNVRPEAVTKKPEEVDIEAIKKEDKELQDNQDAKDDSLQKHEKLYEQQQKLMEENKKLLEQLKVKQDQEDKVLAKVKEQKMQAVKNIESLAKLALESIADDAANKLSEEKLPKPSVNSTKIDSKVGRNVTSKNILQNFAPLPIALAQNSNRQTSAEKLPELIEKAVDIQDAVKVAPNKEADVNILQLLKGTHTKIQDTNGSIAAEVQVNQETKEDKGAEVDLNSNVIQENKEDKGAEVDINSNVMQENKEVKGAEVDINSNVIQENKEVKGGEVDINSNVVQETKVVKEADNIIDNLNKIAEPVSKADEKLDSIRRDLLTRDNYVRRKRDVEEVQCEKNLTDIAEPKIAIDISKVDIIPLSRDLKNVDEV